MLLGRSLGGHGAIRLALRHPDVFGVASIDAGSMAVVEGYLPNYGCVLAETPGPPYEYAPTSGTSSAQFFSFCAAFTPNLDNPPWAVDFILDATGVIDPDVYNRMLDQSPPAQMENYAGSDLELDLFFRIGDEDEFADTFWPVIDGLDSSAIPHVLRVFHGNHWTPPLVEKLAVHLTYITQLNATVDLQPRILNARNWGPRVQASLELPGDLEAEEIDASTMAITEIDGVALESPLQAFAAHEISDLNGNGRHDLTVWIDKRPLLRRLFAMGIDNQQPFEVTVEGETSTAGSWPRPTSYAPSTCTILKCCRC